ncbi:MAG TPA: HAD family hydrolase [Cytophagales bacterium]|jgi:putative hydrolase of the HAD superfamily|nr:HAD family hydrolase [Cytophagales bacterium]
MRNLDSIKVIGFDADDTLWINEPFFREKEAEFAQMFSAYGDTKSLIEKLHQIEIGNLKTFGYGIKNFTISMIETAIVITDGKVNAPAIQEIIELGRAMTDHPVVLLNNIAEALDYLYLKYRLILVTKGDLMEQERKLRLSKLEKYFHHIEIMSEKHEENYQKLVQRLDILPEQLLMVGNSLRSDIIPPLNIGCKAIHVPFETTWIHEQVSNPQLDPERFQEISTLHELLDIL